MIWQRIQKWFMSAKLTKSIGPGWHDPGRRVYWPPPPECKPTAPPPPPPPVPRGCSGVVFMNGDMTSDKFVALYKQAVREGRIKA